MADKPSPQLPSPCYGLLNHLDKPGRLPVAIADLPDDLASVDAVRLCEHHKLLYRLEVSRYADLLAGKVSAIFNRPGGTPSLRITPAGRAALAEYRLTNEQPQPTNHPPQTPLPPMSDREEQVYSYVRSEGPKTGKQISKHFALDSKSLDRTLKALKSRGVKNRRGVGYYLETPCGNAPE